MYYYTYVIVLTEGSWFGKLYFGKRTCRRLPDDKYRGSGKLLKDYYKSHPTGYIKLILRFYNSLKELNKAEYDLIHQHLGKDYCLNLIEGGGGCSLSGEKNGFYGHTHSDEQKKRWSETRKNVKPSDETRKLQSEIRKGKPTWNKGKTGYHYKTKRSEEYKEKQRLSHLGKRDSEETKAKKRKARQNKKPNLGKQFSEEWKHNCGNSTRNKHRVYDNEEHTKWHMEY